MEYMELKKFYYTDKEKYEEEYQRRISSPETVVLDFEIKGKPAFFVQTPALFGLVSRILRADKKIQFLDHTLPGVAIGQFARRCLVDEIVLTNRIEGVNSTRKEIQSIIGGIRDPEKKERVKQRFFGLTSMYIKLKEETLVSLDTCEDIRALYDELVLPDVAQEHPNWIPDGKLFRKDSVSVATDADREIHRGAYPESEIIKGLEKALAFLKTDDLEILFRIAVFHYMLEYIHPFYDGNGRLGRFIVSYLLAQNFEPLLSYRISYTIREHINEYYRAFKVCNDPKNRGDVTPFALMMLRLIAESSERLVMALEERRIVLERYRKSLTNFAEMESRSWHTYDYLVQASLFSERGISTTELEDCLRVSYVTVSKELRQIEARGLLKKTRYEKENYYTLDLDKFDELITINETET